MCFRLGGSYFVWGIEMVRRQKVVAPVGSMPLPLSFCSTAKSVLPIATVTDGL